MGKEGVGELFALLPIWVLGTVGCATAVPRPWPMRPSNSSVERGWYGRGGVLSCRGAARPPDPIPASRVAASLRQQSESALESVLLALVGPAVAPRTSFRLPALDRSRPLHPEVRPEAKPERGALAGLGGRGSAAGSKLCRGDSLHQASEHRPGWLSSGSS